MNLAGRFPLGERINAPRFLDDQRCWPSVTLRQFGKGWAAGMAGTTEASAIIQESDAVGTSQFLRDLAAPSRWGVIRGIRRAAGALE